MLGLITYLHAVNHCRPHSIRTSNPNPNQDLFAKQENMFRWNLAYADTYTDLLWEKNTIRSLKNTDEVVQANR